MRWFNKWILSCVNTANSYNSGDHVEHSINNVSDFPRKNKTTFSIHAASGGVVIEKYQYLDNDYDNATTLIVVPNGEDIAEAIASIIIVDALKK
jgi:hypothetical protein